MARFFRLNVLNTMVGTGVVPVFYDPSIEVSKKVAAACDAGRGHFLRHLDAGVVKDGHYARSDHRVQDVQSEKSRHRIGTRYSFSNTMFFVVGQTSVCGGLQSDSGP